MQREIERNDKATTQPAAAQGQKQSDVATRRTLASPALFPRDQIESFGREWALIQAAFVDDPRSAVGHASDLVGRAVGALTAQFERERTALEEQWARGEEVSTEELRVMLQRYRAFFQRVLSV